MTRAQQQRRLLPSHAVLRSFECAARQESFTLAAEELHLTQSAISRQVKELEQLIGTDLFRRTGRRVVLTEAGRALAAELATDLENIRQTVLRAIASGARGTSLRVAVLPTFASRWLIPRLPDFSTRHPEVTVNLTTRLKPFDLAVERFDIAIHYGADDWPDTRMQQMFDEEMIAVCAPDFKTRHAIPDPGELQNPALLQNLALLQDLPLLHLETRPTAWADWFGEQGAEKQVFAGQQFDQFSMLIAGALGGLGAALLPKYLIERELASGALITLSSVSLRTENRYFTVTKAGARRPEVENFCAWILSASRSVKAVT
jgi:LysR family transcriptional regulator, glycine cleavage system transcriptional activator